MSDSMSIYDLQATLVGLMDIVTDPETTPEEKAVAEQEIARYVAAEIVKVDGIRAYLRHCDMMESAAKQERDLQAERAQVWESRARRLKQFCLDAMGLSGKKKLEGRTGALTICGNGGLQPLVIDDESLVPNEYCEYEGRIPASVWLPLLELALDVCAMNGNDEMSRDIRGLHVRRVVDGGRVRMALTTHCPACQGAWAAPFAVGASQPPCSACGCTGKQGVPGAHLEPRGEHLRVK